ncbi:hypothetical protein [Testudinibacter aquarius]|uniref:Uncharacterized protein n=1 Tax=Testudinibacter aquarius TaxID=1524974 RepID=A0A4R3YAK6_9PAST|nr:hypothetical protein [Testudinibacter aquarius]KAE9525716.1 hypothetical protein A1D24_03865 [Testudinibacter aquarius]TCV88721.1 hypothetical protein EDC16_10374 [Testudinibacter aquarius]TNG87725.1 hypothetical protein FHQ21_11840 [Testudinibacter aquarius]
MELHRDNLANHNEKNKQLNVSLDLETFRLVKDFAFKQDISMKQFIKNLILEKAAQLQEEALSAYTCNKEEQQQIQQSLTFFATKPHLTEYVEAEEIKNYRQAKTKQELIEMMGYRDGDLA